MAPYDSKFSYTQRLQVVETWLSRHRGHPTPLHDPLFRVGGHTGSLQRTWRNAATRDAIRDVDAQLAKVVALIDRHTTSSVNVLIVSDHGMTPADPGRRIWLDELLPKGSYELISHGATAGLNPVDGYQRTVENILLAPHPHM